MSEASSSELTLILLPAAAKHKRQGRRIFGPAHQREILGQNGGSICSRWPPMRRGET